MLYIIKKMSKQITLGDGEQISIRTDPFGGEPLGPMPKSSLFDVNNITYETFSRYAMIQGHTIETKRIHTLRIPRIVVNPTNKKKYVVIGINPNVFTNIDIDYAVLPNSLKTLDIYSFNPSTIVVLKTSLDLLTNIIITSEANTMQGPPVSTGGANSPIVDESPLNEFALSGESDGLVVNQQYSLLTGFPDEVGKFRFNLVSTDSNNILIKFMLVVNNVSHESFKIFGLNSKKDSALMLVILVLLLIVVAICIYLYSKSKK